MDFVKSYTRFLKVIMYVHMYVYIICAYRYDVCQTKKITKTYDGIYTVRYSSGRYVANLLAINDNSKVLTDIKQNLSKDLPKITLETLLGTNVSSVEKKDVYNTTFPNAHTQSVIDTTKEDNKVNTYMKEINTFYDIYGSPDQVRNNNTDIESDYTTSTLSMPTENSCGNTDSLDLDTDNTSLTSLFDNTSINNEQQKAEQAIEIVEAENVQLSSSFIKDLSSDKGETDKESCDNTAITDYEPNDSDYSSDDSEVENSKQPKHSRSFVNDTSTIFYNSSANNTTDTSFDTSLKLNVEGFSACDDTNMFVETSRGPKGQGKTNFCFFCNKMQTKIVRHLETVHKDEEEVKKFRFLPKGNSERRHIIDCLRRKGNFIYNVDPRFNAGNVIPCRRPRKSLKRTAVDFAPCAKCKGYFAKSSLRYHFRHCHVKQGQTVRSTLALARKVVGHIHKDACQQLREHIFPIMKEDNVVRAIRYDSLIIKYRNKMCKKYILQHQHDMIRAHLRLLGRYLITIKEIDSEIKDFASIYDPKFYNSAIRAVNIVAGLNETTNTYKTPTVASTLGTCIKKLGQILESECIKEHDKEKKEYVHDFLLLLEEDYGCTVNRVVLESRLASKRHEKVILPLKTDIVKLNDYIKTLRESSYQKLQNKFTYHAWLTLAKATLIYIQIFNRRRAGETERLLINDLNKSEQIDESDEQYRKLCPEDKETAARYRRVVIRGKLRRLVLVLLDFDMRRSLKTILKFRKNAGISSKNPYVFGIPGYYKNRYKYLRACKLLCEFAHECGAKRANSLRGTILRKHIATTCASLDLPENKIDQFANFMGHHEKVHKQIYRQPVAAIDILDMSKVLEKGLGIHENEEDINYEDTSKKRKQKFTLDITKDDHASSKNNDRNQNNIHTYNTTNTNKSKIPQISAYKINQHKEVTNSTKKKRSTSPFGKTIRCRWNEEEKKVIFSAFRKNIMEKKLPSLLCIEKLRSQKFCLRNRSAAVIKTWIHNQIKKTTESSVEKYTNTNDISKEDIKSIFADHIKKKIIPSINECVTAYTKSTALQNLSPTDIQDIILKEIHNPSP